MLNLRRKTIWKRKDAQSVYRSHAHFYGPMVRTGVGCPKSNQSAANNTLVFQILSKAGVQERVRPLSIPTPSIHSIPSNASNKARRNWPRSQTITRQVHSPQKQTTGSSSELAELRGPSFYTSKPGPSTWQLTEKAPAKSCAVFEFPSYVPWAGG